MSGARTPEEKAKSKAVHVGFQIAGGAGWVVSALLAAGVLLSGRGDAPAWLFGRGARGAAGAGAWTNRHAAVAFEDWGTEAFARARREGKLVLLFLAPEFSAPAARMQADVFGNVFAARFAGERFVPVRVDSARFPDLDRRYRARGWPTVALLTADGVALDAGGSMTAEIFQSWAAAVANSAAERPQALARIGVEAYEARRAEAAGRSRSAPPPAAADAAERARSLLLAAWDPEGRTFDREGPRFPRFERLAALAALPAPWARELSSAAAEGAEAFLDPRDGGAYRILGPDGGVIARERLASEQAAALDALCALRPQAAARVLGFVAGPLTPKDSPARYFGWQGGYVLSKNFSSASDGPDFAALERDGFRPLGDARLGENAELARAVLACRASSAPARSHARAVVRRASAQLEAAATRRDPRLLLDDAIAVGEALLVDGRPEEAASARRWMERRFAEGAYYLDRLPTRVLPPETDRLADPALNARALDFLQRLGAALPPGGERASVRQRAEALRGWLAARADSVDPAVWAALNAR